MVVCDRYVLSSLVYQGIECGDELPQSLNSSFPAPQLLLFFDIEPETAIKRIQNRSAQETELYEYLEFQQKVRTKYHQFLAEFRQKGVKVVIIDASQSPETVAEAVWSALSNMPILKA